MSTHNIGFYEDLSKIIFQLSSNHTLSLLLEKNIFDIWLRVFVELDTDWTQMGAAVKVDDWKTSLYPPAKYPPQNLFLGGYTVFSLSVILSFCNAVIPWFHQHLKYN